MVWLLLVTDRCSWEIRWSKLILVAVWMKEFVSCTTQLTAAPKPTMYPPSPVHTVTTEEFAKRAPKAFEYFTKRGFTNNNMNQILAWMEDNQADGEEAMFYFLRATQNLAGLGSTRRCQKVKQAL